MNSTPFQFKYQIKSNRLSIERDVVRARTNQNYSVTTHDAFKCDIFGKCLACIHFKIR